MKLPVTPLAFAALFVSFASGPAALAAAKKTSKAPPAPQRDDTVRLQIFLDSQNFGPGKIDGQFGGFTKLSWQHYQQAQGQTPRDDFDVKTPPLSSVGELYTTYAITSQDLSAIGKVPAEVPLQAKEQALPYTSLPELLGERFHASVQFLRELNAPKNLDQLKEGDQITAPNVTPPFTLDAVLAARQATADAKKKPEKTDEPRKSGKDASQAAGAPPGTAPAADLSKRFVHVSVKDAYLELHDGDKIVAAFPVTPGSTAIPSPKGEWKIESKTLLPVFRWDKEMLNHGKRSEDFYHLPAGPNNPVGIAWIALNRPGIGLHGTNEPETIGRSASHGCIRLANWDAFKLYGMVEKGMRVVIE